MNCTTDSADCLGGNRSAGSATSCGHQDGRTPDPRAAGGCRRPARGAHVGHAAKPQSWKPSGPFCPATFTAFAPFGTGTASARRWGAAGGGGAAALPRAAFAALPPEPLLNADFLSAERFLSPWEPHMPHTRTDTVTYREAATTACCTQPSQRFLATHLCGCRGACRGCRGPATAAAATDASGAAAGPAAAAVQHDVVHISAALAHRSVATGNPTLLYRTSPVRRISPILLQ